MFLAEIGAGLVAGSASLLADALDFFGDAANYAISLTVIGMALRYRATAAFAKGVTMGLFGLWIIGTVIWHMLHETLPSAVTMGAVGSRHWPPTRHPSVCCGRTAAAMPTCARLGFAPATTFSAISLCCWRRLACCTQTGWPDIIVAAIMAALALQGATIVIRQSLGELRQPVIVPAE